jgi:hypothetical protein
LGFAKNNNEIFQRLLSAALAMDKKRLEQLTAAYPKEAEVMRDMLDTIAHANVRPVDVADLTTETVALIAKEQISGHDFYSEAQPGRRYDSYLVFPDRGNVRYGERHCPKCRCCIVERSG